MTSTTPSPAPHQYPYPAPFGAPLRPRSPGLVDAARIVAGVQAALSGLFSLVILTVVLPWAAAAHEEDRKLLSPHSSTDHTLALVWTALAFGVLAGVAIGVPALCMRAGGRGAHTALLAAEGVACAVAIGLAIWQRSDGWGLLAALFTAFGACVVSFACSPVARSWARG